ncbi:MAG: hypothetical protein KHZ04_02180 [Dorea sp.]|jgi:di/tripeptidase|nr:hypothetical protein [Dorea sp.]
MIYNKNMKCRKRESKMKAYERFLKYVSVWTTSDENSETVPSADIELVLAKLLVEEMKELGIVDARVVKNADIVLDVAPIRGRTDGARLSFKGLPCPNLGTGGYAFHGVYEHITVEGMDKVVVMVKDIVGMFAK